MKPHIILSSVVWSVSILWLSAAEASSHFLSTTMAKWTVSQIRAGKQPNGVEMDVITHSRGMLMVCVAPLDYLVLRQG